MKTYIFFDLDRTIYDTNKKEVPSQTIDLLKRLQANPNVKVGLATGRNINKSQIINDILPLFDYKIYINGALAFNNDELLISKPISKEEVLKVFNKSREINEALGYVGANLEYITHIDEFVLKRLDGIDQQLPEVLLNACETMDVYQLWLFNNKPEILKEIINKTNLQAFTWHTGGVDIIRKDVSKGAAILEILKSETNYRLITVGDGHNDISMIEIADVGIAMGNSSNEELKKKADYIAPNIDDNQLDDFFKTIFSDLNVR